MADPVHASSVAHFQTLEDPRIERTKKHNLPHDTFGRVFACLKPTHLQACFLSWSRAVAALRQGALVSLAGQTVRASFDRATAASPYGGESGPSQTVHSSRS
jgi:hypothetical protein